MKRLLLVFLAACASSRESPRAQVSIAPPAPSAADAERNFDAPMNAEASPHNESDEELHVMITQPKNATQGPPVVHVDDDTTELGGQRAVVRRVVRRNLPKLRACYERGLATKPDLAGRVVVRFTIDPSGSVTNATTADPTPLGADVVACVLGVFRALQFPQPRAGSLVVDYPIVFAQ